jgi:alkanesulfonate monooxygenase SsuD/methylene tetrahydromethanopterin reductase-like flavin-dependent oxidoreductase (luciferase family)
VDKAGGRYSDPSKIHKINHVGARYKVEGPHLPSPSPQRTPLLFQAGGSPRGIRFAAKHAEAVFIGPPDPAGAKLHTDNARAEVVRAGRRAEDLTFFQGISFIVGATHAEVDAKREELERHTSVVGYLTHSSLGILPDGSASREQALAAGG